jgi:DNA invertase Pin-like site-specific DNA recombinase
MEKDNDNFEFFDDCPICQAMKAAKEQGRELTLEELKAAFRKAKKKGAIIGGERSGFKTK